MGRPPGPRGGRVGEREMVGGGVVLVVSGDAEDCYGGLLRRGLEEALDGRGVDGCRGEGLQAEGGGLEHRGVGGRARFEEPELGVVAAGIVGLAAVEDGDEGEGAGGDRGLV